MSIPTVTTQAAKADPVIIESHDLQYNSFNELLRKLNEAANESLEVEASARQDSALISGTIGAALIGAAASLIGTAVSATESLWSPTGAGVGELQLRNFHVSIKSDKWFAMKLKVGVQQAFFLCPPADVDVDLDVWMPNQDQRVSMTSCDFLPIGSFDAVVRLLKEIKGQASETEFGYFETLYETSGDGCLAINFMGTYPEVYISRSPDNPLSN